MYTEIFEVFSILNMDFVPSVLLFQMMIIVYLFEKRMSPISWKILGGYFVHSHYYVNNE